MQQNQTHVVAHPPATINFIKGGIDISFFNQNNMEQLNSSGIGSLAIISKSLFSRSFTCCGDIPKNAWILGVRAIIHMSFGSSLLSIKLHIRVFLISLLIKAFMLILLALKILNCNLTSYYNILSYFHTFQQFNFYP